MTRHVEGLRDTLSAWLAPTDIALLELRGPGACLRLLNQAGQVVVLSEAPTNAPRVAVTAPGVGRFLRTHPLHDAPLAKIGDRVQAGQPLGLLQVGSLLRAVTAPVAFAAQDGSIAGYGMPLAELQPLP